MAGFLSIRSKTFETFSGKYKKVYVVTSWDDGRLQDIKLMNLLDKYRVKGTFFIIAGKINKTGYLRNEDIQFISKNHEIASHTFSHPVLTHLSSQAIENEFKKSKELLEKIVDKPIEGVCYPKGIYNDRVVNIAKRYYKYARTVKISNNIKDNDNFHIHTTIQARKLEKISRRLFKTLLIPYKNPRKVMSLLKSKSWDMMAIKLFDYILDEGGIFHLWGHSHEIESNKDWERLENLLNYIAWRNDVEYITIHKIFSI